MLSVWLGGLRLIEGYILPNEGIRKPEYSVFKESNISFTTRDNIVLAADIYHPKGLTKTATILVRIPFTKTLLNELFSELIARYWASRGYTVVIQGTRGRYKSEGKFYPLLHEREDGIDTLKWIAQQSWYDGRLGMWGGSSFGHTQWAIADQINPGPQALMIQIASASFRDMFYRGGAFSLESALFWAMRSRGEQDQDVDILALDKGAKHLPVIDAIDVAIGKTDFFRDWRLNQHNDLYWKKIEGTHAAESLKSPILLMGGWFDPFLPAQLDDYRNIILHANESIANETRLIIGPWKHADSVKLPPNRLEIPYRHATIAPSIPWFDHQLGSKKNPLNMPRVSIFIMGINQWRNENEWPLARTQYVSYFLKSKGEANTLHGNGILEPDDSMVGAVSDEFIYDPMNPVPTTGGAMLSERAGIQLQNEIEKRPDVLVYSTPPMTNDTEVTGPVRALLYVSTDAPSTDFTVKLVDVYPDGSAYNLSDGILRLDHKAIPNSTTEPLRIEIDLWPTSNVFLKGHQIRLEVSSSNFPHYDRNLNTGKLVATASKSMVAHQRIYHSKPYPSCLILPIIPSKS